MEKLRRKWELLKKCTLAKDKFIDVERCIYENPLSKEKKNEDYSIVNFSKDGVVATVALTSDKKVILLRQYRPAADRWIVNLPGGRIDKGLMPEKAAKKELEDETGYSTERFERIYESFSNTKLESSDILDITTVTALLLVKEKLK